MNTPTGSTDRCRAAVAWIVADGAERRRVVVEQERAARQERLAALRATTEKRCADLADRRRADAARRVAANQERTEAARDRLDDVRTAELYRRVARVAAQKARDARAAPATGRRQRDADVARYWAKFDEQRQRIADTKTLTMMYVLKTWQPAKPKNVAVQAAAIVPETPRESSEHCIYVRVITVSYTTTARPVACGLIVRNKWPQKIWPARDSPISRSWGQRRSVRSLRRNVHSQMAQGTLTGHVSRGLRALQRRARATLKLRERRKFTTPRLNVLG